MRFDTEHDAPCPFRLARFGYRRIGEFRVPRPGELYIEPTAGPRLEENEPRIGVAQDGPSEPRHIVEALPESAELTDVEPDIDALLDFLFGPLPKESD